MLVMLWVMLLVMWLDVGFLGRDRNWWLDGGFLGGDRNWWLANVAALTRTRWLSGFVIILLLLMILVSRFIFRLGSLIITKIDEIHSTIFQKITKRNLPILQIGSALSNNAGHVELMKISVDRTEQTELYTVYIEGDYCIWVLEEQL